MEIFNENEFISDKFGKITDDNINEKSIILSKEELLNLLIEFKQKITMHKAQSIHFHFDGVGELLESVDELRNILKLHHELYRETLIKEGIPFKETDMYGMSVPHISIDDT